MPKSVYEFIIKGTGIIHLNQDQPTENGGITKNGTAVLHHRNGSSESPGIGWVWTLSVCKQSLPKWKKAMGIMKFGITQRKGKCKHE